MPKYTFIDEPQQKEESLAGTLGRGIARSGARAAEAVVGLPGDIVSTGLGLAGGALGFDPSGVQKVLPTSQNLKEAYADRLGGDYLKPQNSTEEFLDNIVGDAATILIPFGAAGRIGKGAKAIAKATGLALGKSAVGNLAGWAAEEVTGSPLAGTAAKLGTLMLANTAGGRKHVVQMQKDAYKKADSFIPKGTMFDVKPEAKQLDSIIHTLTKGDNPNKSWLLDRFESLKKILTPDKPGTAATTAPSAILDASGKPFTSKIPGKRGGLGGKADMAELVKLKQDWNAYIQDPKVPYAASQQLKRGVGILNEAIARYGQKNKNFFDAYKVGEELTQGLKSSNKFIEFMNKHPLLERATHNPVLKYTLFTGLGHKLKNASLPGLAAAGAGAYGIREAARFVQLMYKSPVARSYYKQLVKASLKNDVAAASRALAKLDKVASSNEDYNRPNYQFID